MFNDLTQPNQTNSQTPPVDDIFAETDKTTEAKSFSGYYANANQAPVGANLPADIEAQKAGLSAGEELATSSKGKILKVILIALLIILLISLAYLVYVKFIEQQPIEETINDVNTATVKATSTVKESIATTTATTTAVSEEVFAATSTPLATTTPPVSNLVDTDSDNLTDEEEVVLGTDVNKGDTDGDGLSDYDEIKLYNTNAKMVDTDNDGLSDYEEIKIYKTDPNKADSDDDSYLDGAEVKQGYNPLGAGKLTDIKK